MTHCRSRASGHGWPRLAKIAEYSFFRQPRLAQAFVYRFGLFDTRAYPLDGQLGGYFASFRNTGKEVIERLIELTGL
jgi:hypothetical protein